MEDDLLKTTRDVIAPFAHPRATVREPSVNGHPEEDVLKIEVAVGDWMKLCTLAGIMDGAYLRALPGNAIPSSKFITEIDRLAEKVETAVGGSEPAPRKPGAWA